MPERSGSNEKETIQLVVQETCANPANVGRFGPESALQLRKLGRIVHVPFVVPITPSQTGGVEDILKASVQIGPIPDRRG